ncbi:cytochrome P450 [Mycolicibacterium frederiksbergense]
MATIRAVALLATHPEQLSHCELTEPDQPRLRPYLRACVQESVRLWPTTPALLRETTVDTTFDGTTFEAGASVLICVPAFHRDTEELPFADEFVPEIWLDGRADDHPQLVPFSAGPAQCPGQNLVLFVTSSFIAQLFSSLHLELTSSAPLSPERPLPLTLNQFGLEFGAQPVAAASRGD